MRRVAPVLHLGLRGLTRLPRRDGGAGETQWRWEWAVLPALLGSIPARIKLRRPALKAVAMEHDLAA